MLKAAVDHFGACIHTKDFVVFGKLPLPPSLDTAKMLNRTDRTYLTLVNTSMMQHGHYYANIAHYLDLDTLPNQPIASPAQIAHNTTQDAADKPIPRAPASLAPASVQDIRPKPPTAPPDAATVAGIPVGRAGRTGTYMVDDLLKQTAESSNNPDNSDPTAKTFSQPDNPQDTQDSKDTVDSANSSPNSNNEPINMTSLPKERILWLQGGRVDDVSSSVALRTVYLLYTNYVIYGDMQLAPQMRFSDHLSNTIKTHPFQVLRNVHLADAKDSSYFSDASVLATFDFLTVNLHSIGGAFELGSS